MGVVEDVNGNYQPRPRLQESRYLLLKASGRRPAVGSLELLAVRRIVKAA